MKLKHWQHCFCTAFLSVFCYSYSEPILCIYALLTLVWPSFENVLRRVKFIMDFLEFHMSDIMVASGTMHSQITLESFRSTVWDSVHEALVVYPTYSPKYPLFRIYSHYIYFFKIWLVTFYCEFGSPTFT